jgi:hypothetical protein
MSRPCLAHRALNREKTACARSGLLCVAYFGDVCLRFTVRPCGNTWAILVWW